MVALTFQTHWSSFSSIILFVHIIMTSFCSRWFSQSNMPLIHPKFHTYSRLLFQSPACLNLTSLQEEIEKSLGNLSLRVSFPNHLSSHKLISLLFPIFQTMFSTKISLPTLKPPDLLQILPPQGVRPPNRLDLKISPPSILRIHHLLL